MAIFLNMLSEQAFNIKRDELRKQYKQSQFHRTKEVAPCALCGETIKTKPGRFYAVTYIGVKVALCKDHFVDTFLTK